MAWRLAPALAAALVAVAFLITGAGGGDLAAHVFRAELFDREGFTLWNGAWYGGHHAVAYSVLFPPLAGLLGARLAGALAAVAAAALFEPLARRHFGEGAGVRLGTIWFGLGAGGMLFAGRLPFMLGVAVGLGALLALQRRRTALALALAAICSLASPIAGLFLALAGAALALSRLGSGDRAGDRERVPSWLGASLAACALGPALALALVFPEGGHQPFTLSPLAAAIPAIAIVAVVILPPSERALRIGAALYAAGVVAALVLETPVGSNSLRVAELFAGPVLVCALLGRPANATAERSRPARALSRARWLRPALAAAVLAPLLWWSFWPAARDIVNAADDPAFERSYYEPLDAFLERQGEPRWRVEIPFTKAHFEAAEIAPERPLARGWQRQLDAKHNELFYADETLDHAPYERWLRENGVRFVAVADAEADFSAKDELDLVRSRRARDYLRPVWSSAHWRVYEVVGPRPIVVPERRARISLDRLGPDFAALRVERPGSALVRVRWSPYWRTRGGCVERAGDWTRVSSDRPGSLLLEQSFAPGRVIDRGRRCG